MTACVAKSAIVADDVNMVTGECAPGEEQDGNVGLLLYFGTVHVYGRGDDWTVPISSSMARFYYQRERVGDGIPYIGQR